MKKEFEEMREEGLDRKDIAEDEDVVTEVDKKMTKIVNNFFSNQEENYHLVSEEMNKDGRSEGSEQETEYTVIFDEIDGTANMRDYAGPFGPIIAIAKGKNPEFNDVVAAGFFEITRQVYYHAYRNEGAYRNKGLEGEEKSINSGKQEKLEVDTGLLVDQAMLSKRPDIAEEAWRSWCNDFGCQGHNFALVAEGVRDACITGGHGLLKNKNTAEELAAMYLIVGEANGVVVDWKGEEISERQIGLEEGLNHDIVAASTRNLAENICNNIV